jgi:hypothetical protein
MTAAEKKPCPGLEETLSEISGLCESISRTEREVVIVPKKGFTATELLQLYMKLQPFRGSWLPVQGVLRIDLVKLNLDKLKENFSPRMSQDEIEESVNVLLRNGFKPEEIADLTGASRATIYRHKPKNAESCATARQISP